MNKKVGIFKVSSETMLQDEYIIACTATDAIKLYSDGFDIDEKFISRVEKIGETEIFKI